MIDLSKNGYGQVLGPIITGGGPLAFAEIDVAERVWNGVEGPGGDSSRGTDYSEIACKLNEEIEVYDVRGSNIAIIGEEPLFTHGVVAGHELFVIRWISMDCDNYPLDEVLRMAAMRNEWFSRSRPITWRAFHGKCILFDSALPGKRWQENGFELHLPIGNYEFRTAEIEGVNFHVLLHRGSLMTGD